VVPRSPEVDAGGLRGFLRAKLPGFMVPARFVLLASLPLTPNGKLDRGALPQADAGEEAVFVPPRTAVEEVVSALWGQLLRRDQIGVHDDFFALGGHSLLASRMAARLRQIFKLDLPLKSVFEATTVAELARAIEAHEATPGQSDRVARLVRELQGMSAREARARLQQARMPSGGAP
jgi:surfactin family lipopeptide synthetase C